MKRLTTLILAVATIAATATTAANAKDPLQPPDLKKLTTCWTLDAIYPKPTCPTKVAAQCLKLTTCSLGSLVASMQGERCTKWQC
jgi:hypothetical protein